MGTTCNAQRRCPSSCIFSLLPRLQGLLTTIDVKSAVVCGLQLQHFNTVVPAHVLRGLHELWHELGAVSLVLLPPGSAEDACASRPRAASRRTTVTQSAAIGCTRWRAAAGLFLTSKQHTAASHAACSSAQHYGGMNVWSSALIAATVVKRISLPKATSSMHTTIMLTLVPRTTQ